MDAPDLSSLTIDFGEPEPITAEELEGRFWDDVRVRAPRQALTTADQPHAGDDIRWSSIAWVNGNVLPLYTRVGEVLPLYDWPAYPGLQQALLRVNVGSVVLMQFQIPHSFPDERFIGEVAHAKVKLEEAWRVELPVSKTAALRLIKRGKTLEAAFESYIAEAKEERAMMALQRARTHVMQYLVEHSEWEPKRAEVDTEVLARWQLSELAALNAHQADEEDLAFSQRWWLANPGIRQVAANALKLECVVNAIARERHIAAGVDAPLVGAVIDQLISQAQP